MWRTIQASQALLENQTDFSRPLPRSRSSVYCLGPTYSCAPHRHTQYVYDPDGRLLREEIDDEDDGTVDRTVSYTYDWMGNAVTRTFETGGAVTDVLTSTWNCPGS